MAVRAIFTAAGILIFEIAAAFIPQKIQGAVTKQAVEIMIARIVNIV